MGGNRQPNCAARSNNRISNPRAKVINKQPDSHVGIPKCNAFTEPNESTFLRPI